MCTFEFERRELSKVYGRSSLCSGHRWCALKGSERYVWTGERVRGVSEECEEEVRLRSAVATTTGVGEYSAPNMIIILSRVQCRAEVITSDALNMLSVGRVSCYYQLLSSLVLFHFLDYKPLWPVILKVDQRVLAQSQPRRCDLRYHVPDGPSRSR